MDDEKIIGRLAGGRKVSLPLGWFPSLAGASRKALKDFGIPGDGEGIHWAELDEDLSVEGLLAGNRWEGKSRDPREPLTAHGIFRPCPELGGGRIEYGEILLKELLGLPVFQVDWGSIF